jgi:hypothetical protein
MRLPRAIIALRLWLAWRRCRVWRLDPDGVWRKVCEPKPDPVVVRLPVRRRG